MQTQVEGVTASTTTFDDAATDWLINELSRVRGLPKETESLSITPSTRYGVWCFPDKAWCRGTIGTHAHASEALPRWQSGEAANVKPERFVYELRRCVSREIEELRDALDECAKTILWCGGDFGQESRALARAKKLIGT